MIITCPNCSSRYKVKDGLITEKGKKVKCRKCTAVFIAYPDRDAVLEKAPQQPADNVFQSETPKAAAPAPQAPPAQPAAQAPPSQPAAPTGHTGPSATVKVDRSQLDAFLKKSSQGDAPPAPQPTAPPTAQTPPTPQTGAQATVQVDRSQIDAFLKQGPAEQTETPSPEPPRPEPPPTVTYDGPPPDSDVFATQAIPAFDPNALAEPPAPPAEPDPQPQSDVFATQAIPAFDPSTMPEPPAPAPAPPSEPADAFATQAFSNFDPSSMTPPAETPAAPEPSFDAAEAPSFDSPAESSFDTSPDQSVEPPAEEPDFGGFGELDAAAPGEPAFPSDDELGIGNEPAAPVDQAAPTTDLPTIEPPAPPAPDPQADAFATPDFGSFDNAAPAAEPAPATAAEQLYQAKVDGNVYPSLNLESIARWIQEGRLLETDEIALQNTDNYATADSYDEIKPYFDQFFGSQSGAKPAEKKGFFSKLFSFKK